MGLDMIRPSPSVSEDELRRHPLAAACGLAKIDAALSTAEDGWIDKGDDTFAGTTFETRKERADRLAARRSATYKEDK